MSDARIRTSWPQVGSSIDGDYVREKVATAFYENRGIWFSVTDLDRMPWRARELIEAEARRIYGERRK